LTRPPCGRCIARGSAVVQLPWTAWAILGVADDRASQYIERGDAATAREIIPDVSRLTIGGTGPAPLSWRETASKGAIGKAAWVSNRVTIIDLAIRRGGELSRRSRSVRRVGCSQVTRGSR
jgi:hypothetical protein